MGSLAMWSGVAGAAKGWQENVEHQRTEEKSQLDHDRQMAIERFRADRATELETQRQEGATERTTIGAETDIETTGMVVGGRAEQGELDRELRVDLQEREQEWRSGEAELERQLKRDITSLTQRHSRSDPRFNSLVDRYQSKTLKEGETPEGMPPGYIVERDTPAVFDQETGTWWLQDNGKLIQPGDTGERITTNEQGQEVIAVPNSQHVTALMDNPDQAPAFIQRFGYLPQSYLQARRMYDLEQYTSGGGSSSTSTTTPSFLQQGREASEGE